MITKFLQQQIDFIKTTVETFMDLFEEPIQVEFILCDVFSAAVVQCDSEKLIYLLKRRLFNWQLENTSSWNDQLIHITDQEGKCLLTSTVQNQQITILQC